LIEQRQLNAAIGLLIGSVGNLSGVKSSLLIKLSKPRDDTLPWPSFGSIGFNEGPVGVSLSIFDAKLLSKEHAGMLRIWNHRSSPKVVTTTGLSAEFQNLGSLQKTGKAKRPPIGKEKLKKSSRACELGK
jgi:hypothetical protein